MSLFGAVLALAGVAVLAASAIGAMCVRDVLVRLHFLTPVTSVGSPLIGAGIAVVNGWGLASVTVVLIVAMLAVTGPVVQSATARLAGHHIDVLGAETPP